MLQKKHVIRLAILYLLGLIGCTSSNRSTPLSSTSVLSTPPPVLTLVWISPNASPTFGGSLSGFLIRSDGTPVKGIVVYAGAISTGTVPIASVDPLVDPKSETGANGEFVFENLLPGEYALIAQTPFGLMLLHDINGHPVIFKVSNKEVTPPSRIIVDYPYPDG